MLDTALDDLSAAQKERLAYIEMRLWFLGCVSRKDVLQRFAMATAAGTRDMVLYSELAPNNVIYEAKTYYLAPGFSPLFEHQIERVLSSLLQGFGDGVLLPVDSVLPSEIPRRLNQPSLSQLACVTRAIYHGLPLQLQYFSMKTGQVPRQIVPLALVDNGMRWHVRAYDRSKSAFGDLVLTRMDAMQAFAADDPRTKIAAHENLTADHEWQKKIELVLVPHPSHPHPESIRRDYNMPLGGLRLQVRAAIAGYILRHWQVDCSAEARHAGAYSRLWLENQTVLNGIDRSLLAALL